MDENKQIDEMAELLNIIEKAREDYANDVTGRTENEYIREGLLDAGYRKQEWISVEERLPEVGEDVLLYSKEDDKIDIGHYSNMFRRFFLRKFEDGNVTHWMPLPDAPKGE